MCEEKWPAPIKESEVFQTLSTIDARIETLFNKLQPILFVSLKESSDNEKPTKTELLGRLQKVANNLGELIEQINL